MSSLSIKVVTENDTTIIKLGGAADMTEAQELSKQLEIIVEQGCSNIIVDMRELQFVCSMALGSLIQLRQKCCDKGIKLSLLNIQPSLKKVLQTTQLDHLFNICDSMENALK